MIATVDCFGGEEGGGLKSRYVVMVTEKTYSQNEINIDKVNKLFMTSLLLK